MWDGKGISNEREVMLIPFTLIVVPLVYVFSKHRLDTKGFNTKQQQYNHNYRTRMRKHSSVQEIRKCCPVGLHLDDWYNCTQKTSVDRESFFDEVLEIGAGEGQEYVVTQNYDWRNCPMKQRHEFEVLHIPQVSRG